MDDDDDDDDLIEKYYIFVRIPTTKKNLGFDSDDYHQEFRSNFHNDFLNADL